MTTDASRLMRPDIVLPRAQCITAMYYYCQAHECRFADCSEAGGPLKPSLPYEGSSRMKGNFHVRFLGGCGLATARIYPTNR